MIFDKSITDRNFIEKPLFCSIAMIEKDFQDKSDILCFQSKNRTSYDWKSASDAGLLWYYGSMQLKINYPKEMAN